MQQRLESLGAQARVTAAEARAEHGVAEVRLDVLDGAALLEQRVDVGAAPEELVEVVIQGAVGEGGGEPCGRLGTLLDLELRPAAPGVGSGLVGGGVTVRGAC